MARKITTHAFAAIMAALANILSFPPFLLPLGAGSFLHFTQLPILIAGIFAGPVAGLMAGGVGGLSMSFLLAQPFPLLLVA